MFGGLTLDDCFDLAFWAQLVGFSLVRPHDDVLPARATHNGMNQGRTR